MGRKSKPPKSEPPQSKPSRTPKREPETSPLPTDLPPPPADLPPPPADKPSAPPPQPGATGTDQGVTPTPTGSPDSIEGGADKVTPDGANRPHLKGTGAPAVLVASTLVLLPIMGITQKEHSLSTFVGAAILLIAVAVVVWAARRG